MRTINITRKMHFAGILIGYYCIMNMDRNEFIEINSQIDIYDEEDRRNVLDEIPKSVKVIPIKSGKRVSFDISDDEKFKFFIFAHSTPSPAVSNEIIIKPGNDNENYLIKTISSFVSGITLEVNEI